MIKKIGGFLEEHVEKIILIIIGLLCSWLLITRVLLTPNVIEYNNKNYSPGNIDQQIYQDAIEKSRRPDTSVIDINPPDERNYEALFSNPLGNTNIVFPTRPGLSENLPPPPYPVPNIANVKVTDVAVEFIRSVAYEPTAEVTMNKPYSNNNSEPNDLDFVTVSANLDISKIIDEFKRCYETGVSAELADPCKAKPIFAQVDLQRQRLLPDGQWSDWENIPRTKIDYNKNLFKYVEKGSDLPIGGFEIYKFQLNHILTQLQLLQPEPYRIASANEEWLPPVLHQDFIEAQKKDERDAKRLSTTTTTPATDSSSDNRRRGGSTLNTGVNSQTTGITGNRRRGGSTTSDTTSPTTRRRGGRGTTTQNDTTNYNAYGETESYVDQVYDEFESIILTNKEELTEVSNPILFWGHDDTVQPKNTYRYRIRVGVLNPAPKNNDDNVVFWTSFSNITPEVSIPGKIYFFAGEVQEAAKTVSVSVYKLALGYWYKKVFDRVGQGEMIGGIAEVESKEPASTTDVTGRITEPEEEFVTVDFTTGAIMVDVVRASEWTGGGTSTPIPYHDMMYTYDGKEILHMPAMKTPNPKIWPQDLYQAYSFVQSHMNDKYEPLKSWGSNELPIEQIRTGQQYNRSAYR